MTPYQQGQADMRERAAAVPADMWLNPTPGSVEAWLTSATANRIANLQVFADPAPPQPPADDAVLVEAVARAVMDQRLWTGAYGNGTRYAGSDVERDSWRATARAAIAAVRAHGERTMCLSVSAEAAAGVAYRQALDAAWKAAMSCRYAAPSMWGADRPRTWDLPGECSPRDAAMHDNGCVDAMRAIRALPIPPTDPAP